MKRNNRNIHPLATIRQGLLLFPFLSPLRLSGTTAGPPTAGTTRLTQVKSAYTYQLPVIYNKPGQLQTEGRFCSRIAPGGIFRHAAELLQFGENGEMLRQPRNSSSPGRETIDPAGRAEVNHAGLWTVWALGKEIAVSNRIVAASTRYEAPHAEPYSKSVKER